MSGDMRRSSDGLVGDAVKDLHAKENRKADAEELLHYLILSGGNSPLEKTMLSNVFENHDLSVLFKESRMKQKTNTGKFAQKNGISSSEVSSEGLFVCLIGSKSNFAEVEDLLREDQYEIRQCRSFSICKGHHDINKTVKDKHLCSCNEKRKLNLHVWFPRHISDLNKCKDVSSDVNPQLDSNHPGFKDHVYRDRRSFICNLTKDYKIGEKIPPVDYTENETTTWKEVYNVSKSLHNKWACSEYLRCFRALEEAKIYSPEFIPQLQEVSVFLQASSGFQLCPVSGLLSARDFLASLAFKVFQCTQYVRHHTSPMHTPEPDCCHELLGHVPMLCDPTFARFSQEVGLASLGASDEDIVRLATLYWFTVEFGLCQENGELKAYGAGLLSSFGELQHAVSDVPQHLPLDAEVTSSQPYQDATYQSVYFVSNSFENAIAQVRSFSKKNIKRNFFVRFNEDKKKVDVIPKMTLNC